MLDSVLKIFDRSQEKVQKEVSLEDQIIVDMVLEGLDPLNRNDVNKFWTSRGVHINA